MQQKKLSVRSPVCLYLAAVIAWACAVCVAAQPDTVSVFFPGESFDPSVPAPRAILGFPLASRPATPRQVLQFTSALAAGSNRVKRVVFGASHEGRQLVYLIISSPDNLKNLSRIKAGYKALSDPRTLPAKEEERLCSTLPACAWIGYAIHGDELSSTDAALAVSWRLAAGKSPAVLDLLKNVVVLIDPLMNPDGRNRFLNQIDAFSGAVPNLDAQSLAHRGYWPWGRGNHYFFDMNRDWLLGSQPETRARQKALLLWHPQVVIDSHEMGPFETYLFNPPREPINPLVPDYVRSWWKTFCVDQAQAFDRHGWSYYTREWYEFWFPGYTHAWASHQGAIGILYEQAGVDGKPLKRPDGTILSYEESVHHHVVSSFANLTTLKEHRVKILKDFVAHRREAARGTLCGRRKTLVMVPGKNRERDRSFIEVLMRHGIEMGRAKEAFTLEGIEACDGTTFPEKRFPRGSIVVKAAQPQSALLAALLDWDIHFSDSYLKEERQELIRRRRSKIYDITAWALPLLFNVEAYWSDHETPVPLEAVLPERPAVTPYRRHGRYGAVIDGSSDEVLKALVFLLKHGCVVRVAEKDFSVGRRSFPRGSLLLRNHENRQDLRPLLNAMTRRTGVEVVPVDTALSSSSGPDLGGRRFRLVVLPRIAIVAGYPVSTTGFGSLWHCVDIELGLPASPLSVSEITRADLRQYNVLIVPPFFGLGQAHDVLKNYAGALRTWVRNGGTLIAVGGAAAALTRPPFDLTEVRLRRDAITELDTYRRALLLERGKEIPQQKPTEKKESEEVLKEREAWEQIFAPHGALLATCVDQEHWLTFGCKACMPVLSRTSLVFLSRWPVQTPIRYAQAERLLLSGLLWPEAARRLADSAYAMRQRHGKGQVILFAECPTFRTYLRGPTRVFQNAVLFGPGLGTQPVVPWR